MNLRYITPFSFCFAYIFDSFLSPRRKILCTVHTVFDTNYVCTYKCIRPLRSSAFTCYSVYIIHIVFLSTQFINLIFSLRILVPRFGTYYNLRWVNKHYLCTICTFTYIYTVYLNENGKLFDLCKIFMKLRTKIQAR